jgi:hypothetical protein
VTVQISGALTGQGQAAIPAAGDTVTEDVTLTVGGEGFEPGTTTPSSVFATVQDNCSSDSPGSDNAVVNSLAFDVIGIT